MSKVRKQAALQARNTRSKNRVIMTILAIVTLALIVFLLHRKPSNHEEVANSSTMTADESMAWGMQNVQPVLNDALNDPTPEVREIISKLFVMLKNGECGLACPPLARGDAIAFAEWDAEHDTPSICYPTPMVQAIKGSWRYDQYRDILLLITCHEVLHIWRNPELFKLKKGGLPEEQIYRMHIRGETSVWAETITRVIRPMMRDGRYIEPTAAQAERAFANAGNDPTSQLWRRYVEAHLVVPKKEYLSSLK